MMQTQCPICQKPVIKVIETDHEVKNGVICESEFYIHYHYGGNDKLIKIKNPTGAWEKLAHSIGISLNTPSEGLKDFSGQTIVSGM